jgi:hypothetical protein
MKHPSAMEKKNSVFIATSLDGYNRLQEVTVSCNSENPKGVKITKRKNE